MADGEDKDSKTEEPTEKKINDALEKGNTPNSREAPVLASFLGLLLIIGFTMPDSAARLAGQLSRLIEGAGGLRLENSQDFLRLSDVVGLEMGRFIAPAAIILLVGGFAAAWFQNAPRLAFDRIKPDLSKISPKKGWERMAGSQGLVEFIKACFKFIAISIVVTFVLSAERQSLVNAMFTDPTLLPEEILRLTIKLVSGVCIATIVLVAVDLVWVRRHWRKNLRMSRQDLKDEHKQAEGDPLVKARMRSLARDRARNRMMTAIPKATVVVANPTHFAVALRYVREEDGAPMVLAKGQDLIALKIRQVAEDNNIPVVEDKELARALFKQVEVDREIPAQFFRAIAEVIHYIYASGQNRTL